MINLEIETTVTHTRNKTIHLLGINPPKAIVVYVVTVLSYSREEL